MGQKRIPLFLPATRTSFAPEVSASVNTQAAYALTFTYNVTVASTTSIVFTIQGLDEQGNWYTLLASAAVSTVSRGILTIGPATPAVANVSANQVLPLQIRVSISGTATSANLHGAVTLTNSLPS